MTCTIDPAGFSKNGAAQTHSLEPPSPATSRTSGSTFGVGWWRELIGYPSRNTRNRRRQSVLGLRKHAIEQAMRAVHSDKQQTELKPWIHEASQERIWSICRIRAYQIVHTKAMDLTMIAITIFNIILIIYETDEEAQCYPKFARKPTECPTRPENITWLQVSNATILIAYTVEALLRYCADRCAYLESKMNLLDLFICVCDWAGRILGSLTLITFKWFRIFRVFRLCRAFRIVKAIPELNALAMGFKGSMRAMAFGSVLLFLLLMFCSILLVQFVHPLTSRLNFMDCDRCSRGYSSVMTSTLTLFSSIVAGDSWGTINIPAIEEQWWIGILLPVTMLLIGVGAMNLILAVIVEKAVEVREKNKEYLLFEKSRESHRRREEMLEIFHDMDNDASGTLNPREIEEALLSSKRFKRLLRLADVSNQDLSCILDCLDNDHGDEIAYTDFCDVLENFQAADMRKVCVLTNMMVSDLRRQLLAYHDCKLSSIRDLVLEIKQKLESDNDSESGSGDNDLKFAEPQKSVTIISGPDCRAQSGEDQSPLSPLPELSPRQHAQDFTFTIPTGPSSLGECAADVLHHLEAELAEIERGSSRRQEWLLRGLDTSFQELECNLCASQKYLLKAALAAHMQTEPSVKHTTRRFRKPCSDYTMISQSSLTVQECATASLLAARTSDTSKAADQEEYDSKLAMPLQNRVLLL